MSYVDRDGHFAIPLVLPSIEALIVAAATIDAALITNELINWFQNKSKMPTTGVPDSTDQIVTPNGDKLKERKYDENGKVKTDIDWDHDHGNGIPHVHDWTWPIPGGDPVRGPGRPPKLGECK